jgi:hypothetical protein
MMAIPRQTSYQGCKLKKYVRVTASPTADNPDPSQFLFDVVIDPQDSIVGKDLIFGCSYDPTRRSGTSTPFIVDSDGTVDYGIGYPNSIDQYGETDLLDKKMTKGMLLRIWGPGYQHLLRISSVLVLVCGSDTA